MLAEPENDQIRNATPSKRGFTDELRAFGDTVPHKGLFGVVLLAWVALFHFLGNPTLGYIRTRSLSGWLQNSCAQRTDASLGMFVPFIVMALLWGKRDELAAVRKQPRWPP